MAWFLDQTRCRLPLEDTQELIDRRPFPIPGKNVSLKTHPVEDYTSEPPQPQVLYISNCISGAFFFFFFFLVWIDHKVFYRSSGEFTMLHDTSFISILVYFCTLLQFNVIWKIFPHKTPQSSKFLILFTKFLVILTNSVIYSFSLDEVITLIDILLIYAIMV
jgi:hypothetical protein